MDLNPRSCNKTCSSIANVIIPQSLSSWCVRLHHRPETGAEKMEAYPVICSRRTRGSKRRDRYLSSSRPCRRHKCRTDVILSRWQYPMSHSDTGGIHVGSSQHSFNRAPVRHGQREEKSDLWEWLHLHWCRCDGVVSISSIRNEQLPIA